MNNPLISVCIITYNSSHTIIQTLDSIKKQTYDNVELIVSDDCSNDNTIEIVEQWISLNKNCFSATNIISAEENKGTAINLDTAIRNSNGEWIKILAGDDCLSPDCLSVFYKNSLVKTGEFYICDIEPFSFEMQVSESIKKKYSYFFHCSTYSHKKKIRNNLFKLQLAGPAFFFSRKHYLSIFPEIPEYSMLDEWPLVIKTLLSGHDIISVNDKLVQYRVSISSLSHQNNSIGSKLMFDENKLFYTQFLRPELRKRLMFLKILNQNIYYKVRSYQFFLYKKEGIINNRIFKFYQFLPLSLIYKLKQIVWLKIHYTEE